MPNITPSTAPNVPMIALLSPSYAEGMQDGELAPAPQRRQRLRRVDEKAAGE
jgi:hypothetical protein